MDITREMIQKRLQQLQAGREEAIQSLLSTDGAIQEAEHWLEILDTTIEIKEGA